MCVQMKRDQLILQEQYEILRSQHTLLIQRHDEAQLLAQGMPSQGRGFQAGAWDSSVDERRLISAQTVQLEALVGELADELEQARRSEKAALTQLYAQGAAGGGGGADGANRSSEGPVEAPVGAPGFPGSTGEEKPAGGRGNLSSGEAYSIATSVLADRDRDF